MSQILRIGMVKLPPGKMFLEQVILVSTIPMESTSSRTENTYKHTFTKNTHTPSSVNTGSEVLGQVYQVDMGASETFGVKISPFIYRDASIPLNCLTGACNDSYSAASNLVAYHSSMSALFVYAPGKDRPVSRSFGHERLSTLALSPDGQFLLAGTETGSLVLWKMGTGDLICVVEAAHFQAVKVIRFSPDGQTVVSGAADALVKVWSWSKLLLAPSNGTLEEALYTFSQHSAPITDLVLSLCTIGSTRGRLLSASLDGKCNLYDLVDGQLLLNLSFPSEITAVAMNAQETCIFAAGINGNIYPCHLNGSSSTATPAALQFHKGPVSSLKWSLDERVLISAGLEDGHLGFWDPFSCQLLKGLQLSSKKVSCTNLLVVGKSDPSHSDHLSISSSASASASSTSTLSFKRVGNPLFNLSTAAQILPPSSNITSNLTSDIKQKIKDLSTENEELRMINAELCSIIE